MKVTIQERISIIQALTSLFDAPGFTLNTTEKNNLKEVILFHATLLQDGLAISDEEKNKK